MLTVTPGSMVKVTLLYTVTVPVKLIGLCAIVHSVLLPIVKLL